MSVNYRTPRDAAFGKPEIYKAAEAEGYLYAIRLKSNNKLSEKIKHLLTRPVGRPSAGLWSCITVSITAQAPGTRAVVWWPKSNGIRENCFQEWGLWSRI